jgi:hypothetical protein
MTMHNPLLEANDLPEFDRDPPRARDTGDRQALLAEPRPRWSRPSSNAVPADYDALSAALDVPPSASNAPGARSTT